MSRVVGSNVACPERQSAGPEASVAPSSVDICTGSDHSAPHDRQFQTSSRAECWTVRPTMRRTRQRSEFPWHSGHVVFMTAPVGKRRRLAHCASRSCTSRRTSSALTATHDAGRAAQTSMARDIIASPSASDPRVSGARASVTCAESAAAPRGC